jgi:staphylococcal nuclease domain-containing protein 1
MSSSTQQKKSAPVALTPLDGIVKQVLSGDTLVLTHPTKHVDKTLTLARINAPRLARRNEDNEENFAFEAREFLRQKCIGKRVKFQVEYTNPKTGRDYGSVFLDGENLGASLLEQGFATLKETKDSSETYQQLVDAEAKAKQSKVGKYQEDVGKKYKARKVVWADKNFDAEGRLKSFKGKSTEVIVEHVLNGSSLRVLIPSTNEVVLLHMTGVKAPGFEWEDVDKRKGGKEKSTSSPAPTDEEQQPQQKNNKQRVEVAQPFAKEARYYTEMRLLNREVTVLFESTDAHGNLFGTIIINDDEKSKDPVTFQEELLLKGYAKLTEWGAAKSKYLTRLRNAENKAKQENVRIWQGYKAPDVSLTQQDTKEFTAKVVDIISGDTLKIKDDKGNEEKISLSSIRAPRFGNRSNKPQRGGDKKEEEKSSASSAPKKGGDQPEDKKKKENDGGDEPYSYEAREALRKQIAGKKVTVRVDYRKKLERPVFKVDKGTNKKIETNEVESEERRFCTVLVNGRSVAVDIVKSGYASVIRHKPGDERSLFYDQLMVAETDAEKKGKGKFGKKNTSQPLHDITNESISKIEQQVNIIKGKQTKAVVDKVLSATRYKLQLPRENLVVIFSLTGLTAPSMRPKDDKQPKPFAREAVDYAVDQLLFREVDVIIGEKMDKTGSILGELIVKGDNFAIKLLENGFAMLQHSASQLKNYQELKEAENKAKGPYDPEKQSDDAPYPKGINVWSVGAGVYRSPKQQSVKRERVDTGRFQIVKEREVLTARATHIEDIEQFFIQFSDAEADLVHLEEEIGKLDLDQQTPATSVNDKDLILAKYVQDGVWYRARVLEGVSQKDNKMSVRYIDFGNTDRVALSDVRTLPKDSNIAKVRPLAIECALAYVYPHKERFVAEANQFFKNAIEDTDIHVVTEYTQNGVRYVTIEDENPQNETINQTLLRDGLVFLDENLLRIRSKDSGVSSIIEKKLAALKPFQQEALKEFQGLWEDGDVFDEDEEI